MAIARAVLDARNRMTIPEEVQKRLGAYPGAIVEFVIVGDDVEVRRAEGKPLAPARKRRKRKRPLT
jgi:bifunctional DNA-binding transcriptional regulator/antitoxin component of YhaV-PrlF toxin-antitoxin module